MNGGIIIRKEFVHSPRQVVGRATPWLILNQSKCTTGQIVK